MNGIQLMIDEHVYIKRMLKVIRSASLKFTNNEEVDLDDFNKMIDFVRNYADKHHHEKEEKYLFNKMISEIGTVAEKLIKYGMLVEHDFGRLYMQELEIAIEKYKEGNAEAKIDIIANAVGYANLLERHIAKEDEIVYTFANKHLKEDTLNTFNNECEVFENEMTKEGVQKKYIDMLTYLEDKYKN